MGVPNSLGCQIPCDTGIKLFAVSIFADCDRSAKSATEILTREKF